MHNGQSGTHRRRTSRQMEGGSGYEHLRLQRDREIYNILNKGLTTKKQPPL